MPGDVETDILTHYLLTDLFTHGLWNLYSYYDRLEQIRGVFRTSLNMRDGTSFKTNWQR